MAVDFKTKLIITVVLTLLGAGIIIGLIVWGVKKGDTPPILGGSISSKASEAAVPGAPGDMIKSAEVPRLPVHEPTVRGENVRIVPRDTLLKVEYWSDKWRFNQPDIGRISFVVNKNSGLVVSLADQPGYPKAGYAFVIDQRGGQVSYQLAASTPQTNKHLRTHAPGNQLCGHDHVCDLLDAPSADGGACIQLCSRAQRRARQRAKARRDYVQARHCRVVH